jgi:hypothetical protein
MVCEDVGSIQLVLDGRRGVMTSFCENGGEPSGSVGREFIEQLRNRQFCKENPTPLS